MFDLVKKVALAGVGFASLSSEKIEELAGELILKGKLTEMEGRKLVEEMKARAAESRNNLQEQTEGVVDRALEKLNLAHAEEVASLKEEVAALKEQLAKKD